MKSYFTPAFIFLLFVIVIPLHSQEPEDPFNWTEPIIIPSSYYVLWGEGSDEDSIMPNLGVFFNTPTGGVENLTNNSLNTIIGGDKKVYLEVIDLDNSGTDEIIGAWENPDSTVALYFINQDLKERISTEGKIIQKGHEQKRIFIVKGDYDGDETEEFVLAYLGADTTINIILYDQNDGEFVPVKQAAIHDEDLSGNPNSLFRFSIVSGDFDNNGDDELALISYNKNSDPELDDGVSIKVYDIINGEIIPKQKTIVLTESKITQSEFALTNINIAATSVPGYSLQPDMIAFAITTIHNASPNYSDTYLQLVKTNTTLDGLVVDDTKLITEYNNPNNLPAISLVAGDLNDDGAAELLFSLSASFDLYQTDSNLNLNLFKTSGFPSSNDLNNEIGESYDFIQMNNIDAIAGDEVVVIKNIYSNDWENPFPQSFSINVFGVSDGTLSTFGLKSSAEDILEIPYEWPNRKYAVALGNYNNSKVTIEEPSYSYRSAISKPIVVLNAPPVHFDVVNDIIYDINSCYLTGACDFYSTYNKVSSNSEEVTTRIKAAWDVSAGIKREGSTSVGVTVEGAPLGVGVSVSAGYSDNFEYHLMAEYGEHLENTETEEYTTVVNLEVSAIEDDQIFATLTNYDIWEYPYYFGEQEHIAGKIVIFKPIATEGRWFPSKSVSGYSYLPTHEVGNILSYYPYDQIHSNPKVFEYVQSGLKSPTFTLSANSIYDWSVTNQQFTENNAQMEITSGIDAGFMGFGFAGTFDVTDSHLYTQTTTVSESINLSVHIGGIDRTIGPTEYRVTPYSYWSDEGALVIDYSVEPEVDLESGTTWWQDIYGHSPDPTMILPWRLDTEKGFAISDESKRQQTKDILIKPIDVFVGDTAIVSANIRNFSLVNTPSNVKAQFFLGDPMDNGELQSDINGITEFETDEPIPARGSKTISFTWVRPEVAGASRLYMVIDPGNEIDEIHENNNTGWINIQQSAPTSNYQLPETAQTGFKVNSIYPNPVRGVSKLFYSVYNNEHLILTIYNISGVLVKTQVEGLKTPGNYSIQINGDEFDPGIYMYSLRGNRGTQSDKIVIIR